MLELESCFEMPLDCHCCFLDATRLPLLLPFRSPGTEVPPNITPPEEGSTPQEEGSTPQEEGSTPEEEGSTAHTMLCCSSAAARHCAARVG